MGAREGSARLHIFLSPDPSGEGSDPNLYRMVGNDPINTVDPAGLAPVNPSTTLCHIPHSSAQSNYFSGYYSLSAYMPPGMPNRLQKTPVAQPPWQSWFFTKMTANEIQNSGISALQAQNMASQGPYVPKEEDQLRRMGFDGPLDLGHLKVGSMNVNGISILQISDGQHTVYRIGQSWGNAQNYGVQYFDNWAGVQNYINLQFTALIASQIPIFVADMAPQFAKGLSNSLEAATPSTIRITSAMEDTLIPPTAINNVRGWKLGDPINNLTSEGNIPSWSTVRSRFWKNEALNNPSNYSDVNLVRMRKGSAPQRINPVTAQVESMELHHTPPQRQGGLFDVKPVWPDEHAALDPFRQTGN